MSLDLDAFRRAIAKRGFKKSDPLLHPCPKCGAVQGVEKWVLEGRTGGRDIDLCVRCGHASSWRKRPPEESREEDKTFDPVAFMK